jgi:hypothetical protein
MTGIYKGPSSLRWLVPVLIGATVEFVFFAGIVSATTLNHHSSLLMVVIPFCLIAPVGGWWGVYQCIRYEREMGKHITIVTLVPLGFFWYYFERYLPRHRGTFPLHAPER